MVRTYFVTVKDQSITLFQRTHIYETTESHSTPDFYIFKVFLLIYITLLRFSFILVIIKWAHKRPIYSGPMTHCTQFYTLPNLYRLVCLHMLKDFWLPCGSQYIYIYIMYIIFISMYLITWYPSDLERTSPWLIIPG